MPAVLSLFVIAVKVFLIRNAYYVITCVENNVGFIKENGVRKSIQLQKKNDLGFMDWIVLLKIANLKAIRTFHLFFRTRLQHVSLLHE